MADYKIYRLDGAGQIASAPQVITASSDEEVLAAARELHGAYEVWQGRRLVARVGDGAPGPA